jgi:hypothetical protein
MGYDGGRKGGIFMKNKNTTVVRNLIQCLDLESLRNPEVVANLVRAFGIMPWGPNTTGPEVDFIGTTGAQIGQTPDQIAKALVYLSRFKIDSFCEIGVMHGGNFIFCSEYLRRFNSDIKCMGVDPTNYLDSEIREIIEKEMWLTFKSVTSDEIAGMSFDLVFIDADHVAPWPAKDYENVGREAKICVFHDLQDPLWPDVAAFWAALKGAKKEKVEFLDDPSGCSTHGIGIIHEKGIE